ncbi:MAG: protein phosphatase 2C domain-containing protein [Bowdeniella nasicola]|nr:protein phosphatase 2C domain-containing protein [Bowdeniella nasicola]
MSIQFRYAARSDVGIVRSNNQDSGYAGPHLLVLADGMGGPAGGDIASSVAVAHLSHLDLDTPGADDLIDLLSEAINEAHEELMRRSQADPALQGLGTTCIAVMRSGSKLAMVHIGDSRAYLLRDGNLTQLTKDHTYVQHLVDIGRITREEADSHPMRNMVLRALGDTEGEVEIDSSVREARAGDRLLLSSDGLFGVVSHETIQETLAGIADVDACADELITLALRAGAPDNVTVVVCDMLSTSSLRDDTQPPTAPQIVGAVATDRAAKTRAIHNRDAAGRAARLRPEKPSPDVDDDAPTTHPRRLWGRIIGAVLTLAVLLGCGAAAWGWTRTQYYVANDNGYVTVYQGIPQSIGSWKLSNVHHRTDIEVDRLPTYAQQRLQTPTTRSSLEQAEEVVANLRSLAQQAPLTELQEGTAPAESTPPADNTTPTVSPTPTQEG